MNEKISVKPDKIRLINLLENINEGSIQIPIFQRMFIWKPNQMIDLFDSIVNGYPIGSLLFWNPTSTYNTKKVIGPYPITSNKSKVTSYVLDGFQRITTLFSVLINPKNYNMQENSDTVKKYTIYYDLKNKEFSFTKIKKDNKSYQIPLYKIIDTFEFIDFLQELQQEIGDPAKSKILIDNAKEINKIFYDYEIPFVEIKGGDIGSAVRIFSRINSTGTEISEDFMIAALSYNSKTNFLFTDLITEFLNSLAEYNFDDLKRDTVLNCIANSTDKIYFDVKKEVDLLPNLEASIDGSFNHIKETIKFLYRNIFVLNTQLLPYPSQLIFMDNFFRLNNFPTQIQLEKLKKWFWVTTYSNYYTIYSLNQQRKAYETFMEFAKSNIPNSKLDGIYKSEEIKFITQKFPDKLNFVGVRPKALRLFLLQKICDNKNIDSNESIIEQFIFNKKNRTPANILLRLSSEFEKDKSKKEVKNFIKYSDISFLEKYFITKEMQQLFLDNKIDDFLSQRELLIKKAEKEFVKNLGIEYDDTSENEN